MRKILLALSALGLVALAWLYLGTPEQSFVASDFDGDADRGAYVLRVAGCVSCHTKPNGGAFLAGGGPLHTPFGTFYAPNITPDESAGLGNWSVEEFADALLNGHSDNTGHLYPVFPFTAYTKMDHGDLADLWAYLQTVEPVALASAPHDITAPLVGRYVMGPWKTLFFKQDRIENNPERSAAWNRGRYIVEGIGHCTECHTPRGRFGGLDETRSKQGAKLPPKGEKVPAITAAALAKEGYAMGDLMMVFRFGLTPEGDVLGGSMGEVLSDQLQHLTPQDLSAIATYLLDIQENLDAEAGP